MSQLKLDAFWVVVNEARRSPRAADHGGQGHILWSSTTRVQIPALPWASDCATLSLSFFVCKLELIVVPTL